MSILFTHERSCDRSFNFTEHWNLSWKYFRSFFKRENWQNIIRNTGGELRPTFDVRILLYFWAIFLKIVWMNLNYFLVKWYSAAREYVLCTGNHVPMSIGYHRQQEVVLGRRKPEERGICSALSRVLWRPWQIKCTCSLQNTAPPQLPPCSVLSRRSKRTLFTNTHFSVCLNYARLFKKLYF